MRTVCVRYVPGRGLLADALASRVGREADLVAADGTGRAAAQEDPDGTVEVLVVDESVAGRADDIREARGRVRVVVLAADDDPAGAVAAARAGADAWLPRRCTADELFHAVRHVGDGHAFYPREVQGAVLRAMRDDVAGAPPGPLGALTGREREVLAGLADGHEARAIATRLGLSYNTVRTHINEIFRKLGVHSRLAAVRLAHDAERGAKDRGSPF